MSTYTLQCGAHVLIQDGPKIVVNRMSSDPSLSLRVLEISRKTWTQGRIRANLRFFCDFVDGEPAKIMKNRENARIPSSVCDFYRLREKRGLKEGSAQFCDFLVSPSEYSASPTKKSCHNSCHRAKTVCHSQKKSVTARVTVRKRCVTTFSLKRKINIFLF